MSSAGPSTYCTDPKVYAANCGCPRIGSVLAIARKTLNRLTAARAQFPEGRMPSNTAAGGHGGSVSCRASGIVLLQEPQRRSLMLGGSCTGCNHQRGGSTVVALEDEELPIGSCVAVDQCRHTVARDRFNGMLCL